ncbi:MAG: hypothetical protein JWP34_3503 [Massilia sp.]|nr:hypothetical protein [Massilia sp.]
MESISSATRIHPLMAAAAASVVVVSLAGTAAITGLLPSSQSATAPQMSSLPPAPVALAAAPQAIAPVPAPAPVIEEQAPVVKHAAPRPRVIHHYHNQVARNDLSPNYAPAAQQAPQPAQPNYVGIGVGAVVGGLLGNQVGGGNGKKLATVAGVIGGGMLGNEIANRNR